MRHAFTVRLTCWKAWAEARKGVPAFPVQGTHVALYLQHLGESAQSRAPVEEAEHAILWVASASPNIKANMAGPSAAAGSPKGPERTLFLRKYCLLWSSEQGLHLPGQLSTFSRLPAGLLGFPPMWQIHSTTLL